MASDLSTGDNLTEYMSRKFISIAEKIPEKLQEIRDIVVSIERSCNDEKMYKKLESLKESIDEILDIHSSKDFERAVAMLSEGSIIKDLKAIVDQKAKDVVNELRDRNVDYAVINERIDVVSDRTEQLLRKIDIVIKNYQDERKDSTKVKMKWIEMLTKFLPALVAAGATVLLGIMGQRMKETDQQVKQQMMEVKQEVKQVIDQRNENIILLSDDQWNLLTNNIKRNK